MAFTLPIVALLLASAAIWIGANQAILRWVTALRAFAGEIAQGRYRDYEDRFGEAPTEVRDLAADLFRMARTLDERDRRLLEGLDRQQALARELHHRVRNNLQIIASFLSLQADTAEPGARAALDHARLRVSALALVHRLLYAGGELAQVSTRDLIGQVCNLVGQYAHRAAPEVSCDIADLPVEIDTAVPLTLWTLEAIGLLLDGATDARQARLGVQFSVEGDRAHLSVEADGSGGGTVPENNSARLVRSIGRQLGGDARIAGGARRTVALDMPLARLTARSAPGGTKPLP
jgi:two-component sensor histidine kinase